MKQRKRIVAGLVATAALLVAACSSDNKSESTTAPTTGETTAETTGGTTGETTAETTPATEPAAAWAVDTSSCVDEAAATAPITGTIKIGSVMPLSNSPAAAAFAPVKDGLEAYVQYANEQKLLGDLKIEVTVADDEYNAEKTPTAVNGLLDSGVSLITGIIGTPDNLAVRGTLNDNCVPQLNNLTGSPDWGDVAEYPWTTGMLVPYDIESKIYAGQIKKDHPSGAKVALFTVNSEFGQVYVDAFNEVASDYGIDIVEKQTIEATDSNLPTAQVAAIAAAKPDVIMAVPLGAQCVTFLKELANAKAANAGWNPQVYLTNTCASSLILGASGDAANGIYTSGNGIDIGNPANQTGKVKDYFDYMTKLGKGDGAITASVGWTLGEITVATIKQAMESPDGLSRASIIDAARNFQFTPTLVLPGVVLKMDGEKDPFLAQSLVVRQYDATAKTFTDVGTLDTDYES